MQMDFSALATVTPNRKPLFLSQGVVASSQHLASQAGLAALREGGNAVDAALAAAITLTVVEPTSCDVGGDLFALVWDGHALHGLNGSGRAPARLTRQEIRRRGHDEMPAEGWLSVTVPGAPAAWAELHQRFGRLPFAALFAAAIAYAETGFPISPTVFWLWRVGVEVAHAHLRGAEYDGFAPVFAPGGRIPRVGEVWRNPDLARTLQRIAESGAEDFYRGALAERIAAFSTQTDGVLTAADLAAHRSTWVEPIHASYRGYEVWEPPPNGQGLAALIALNILEGFELGHYPRESAERYHLQIEAMKLAFADAHRTIADPEWVSVPTAELLSKEFAARRRTLIGTQALLAEPSAHLTGDTVYLCAADRAGMMVSLIQSNSDIFGSHVVVPGTGMALQNRASNFTLDETHPNRLEPGKRSFHTIMPGFLTHNGEAIGPFGVMGGHMQPQGHVQMIVNTLDYGLDPQASLDAPRWFWADARRVKVEPTVAPAIVEALRQRGHEMDVDDQIAYVGRGQMIWRLPSGIYVAGSEPRADGCAIGY